MQASVVAAYGLCSCGTELNSCGTQAYMLQGSEGEPMFPALAGGFLTAEPPGKPEVREVMSHLFAVKPVNTAVSMAWGTGGGHAPVIPQLNNP